MHHHKKYSNHKFLWFCIYFQSVMTRHLGRCVTQTVIVATASPATSSVGCATMAVIEAGATTTVRKVSHLHLNGVFIVRKCDFDI